MWFEVHVIEKQMGQGAGLVDLLTIGGEYFWKEHVCHDVTCSRNICAQCCDRYYLYLLSLAFRFNVNEPIDGMG